MSIFKCNFFSSLSYFQLCVSATLLIFYYLPHWWRYIVFNSFLSKMAMFFLVVFHYECSARTRTEQGDLENPQQSSIHSPPRASSRTCLLRSPHANAGMKQYECGRTQPLFRAGNNRGINKRSKPKGLTQILIIIMKHNTQSLLQ